MLRIEHIREDHLPRTAVLLEAYNAVYIEVPKVACSSIKIALASLLGIDLDALGGNPHEVDFPAPRTLAGPGLYAGLFTFAFVRNPWDRLVSCYRDKIMGEVRLHAVSPDAGYRVLSCRVRCLSREHAV